MRNCLFIVFLMITCSECLPKTPHFTTNVLNKDTILVVDSKGNIPFVIFPKDMNIPLEIKGIKTRYTPTIQDVKNAETILIKQYNEAHTKDARVLDYKKIKNVEKKLRGYIRQYVGIINQKDEKILLVQLIKYSSAKSKQRYFENWRSEFIVGFGSYYEKNREVYLINIENSEMSLF